MGWVILLGSKQLLECGRTVRRVGDVDFPFVGQADVGDAGGGFNVGGVVMNGWWAVWRDLIFWVALGLYAGNRWLVKPRVDAVFFQSYFNDLLFVPVVLPLVLQLHVWLGWRLAGVEPRVGETVFHCVVWSWVCEWAGPRWLNMGTADGWDVACYVTGAVVSQGWWHWQRVGGRLGGAPI